MLPSSLAGRLTTKRAARSSSTSSNDILYSGLFFFFTAPVGAAAGAGRGAGGAMVAMWTCDTQTREAVVSQRQVRLVVVQGGPCGKRAPPGAGGRRRTREHVKSNPSMM